MTPHQADFVAATALAAEAAQRLREAEAAASAKLQTASDLLKTEITSLGSQLRANIEDIRTSADNTLSTITAESTKAANDLSALRLQYTKELEAMKQAHAIAIATKAPVKHWEDEQRRHATESERFRNRSKLLMIGTSIYCILFISTAILLNPYKATQQSSSNPSDPSGNAGSPSLTAVASTESGRYLTGVIFAGGLIPLALLFWSTRIAVRSHLSHKHLAEDAAIRATMTKSYIAMVSDGVADIAKGSEIVLAQVYRSPAIGLIKDDAAPQTPAMLAFERAIR